MNLRPQETLLDRVVESVRERGRGFDGEEPPVAILWPDPGEEWKGLVALARERLPELLILGDYDPDARTGPAIWLRFVVDRAARGADGADGEGDDDSDGQQPDLAFDRPPILYLPGVGRQDLRAGEDCPDAHRPLVELQHRGAVWRHPNGKDWTAAGFLGSSRGARLRIAEDRGTAEALRQALPELALLPLARLRDRLLQADDFHRLLVADLPRNLLRWLGDPDGARLRLGERWDAFAGQCRAELGDFDPGESGAEIAAGQHLAGGEPAWNPVWERYCEAPEAFPGVALLLGRCRPPARRGGLFDGAAGERWPQENDRLEEALRRELTALPEVPQPEAGDRVARLEAEHGARRGWVWAKLGHSRLAQALEPLARLAVAAKSPLGGSDPDEIAEAYLKRGWRADAASWEAIAAVGGNEADERVVSPVVRHLLEPWLRESAVVFQQAVLRRRLPPVGMRAGTDRQPIVEPGDDGCVFFVDGLRYDLGRRLADRLENRGLRVELGRRWAALPTVTATAKPAVTMVADEIEGLALDETFAPRFCGVGGKATAKTLRAAMEERSVQILGGAVFDGPAGADAWGWLETGEIDKAGHREQGRLARRLPAELDHLAERIAGLLDAGWRRVRVVTDHGWLLLPGGLPRADLPKHLTETRWARCAVLASKRDPGVPRYQWSWNDLDWFASAPGISCFNKSDAYAHGGVSIQECLTPDLVVEREAGAPGAAAIESITWRRFRCLLVVSGQGKEWRAELRLGGPSGAPVSAAKPVDADGSVSLVLSDDEHEDAALTAVVLDSGDRVVVAAETRVGEQS